MVHASAVCKLNTYLQSAPSVTGGMYGKGQDSVTFHVVHLVCVVPAATTTASGVMYGRLFLMQLRFLLL